jgi:hypothetical protein
MMKQQGIVCVVEIETVFNEKTVALWCFDQY